MRTYQIYFEIKFLIFIIHFVKIKGERKVYSAAGRMLSLKFLSQQKDLDGCYELTLEGDLIGKLDN